jgi:hypothetical protein
MSLLASGADTAEGAIDTIRGIAELLDKTEGYLGQKSLIDLTRHLRVEPLLIVDEGVTMLDYAQDICMGMQAMFAGYYLQAIEVVTNIDGVAVGEKLAPLNPNRKFDMALLSYQESLADQNAYRFALPTMRRAGLAREADHNARLDPDELINEKDGPAVSGKDDNLKLLDAANLSVGRLYDVNLRGEHRSATVKVAIRVISKLVPQAVAEAIFTTESIIDQDMKHRIFGVMSGRLGFWKDLVMCNDLLEKKRNAAIKDTSGVYKEILARQNANKMAGLLERNPSLAVASNLAIITKDTANKLEYSHNGKLSNMSVRDRIFGPTSLMILAIVDPNYDRITYYHRGISQGSTVSVRDLKASNKQNGPNPADIMKAFLAGNAPTI